MGAPGGAAAEVVDGLADRLERRGRVDLRSPGGRSLAFCLGTHGSNGSSIWYWVGRFRVGVETRGDWRVRSARTDSWGGGKAGF